MFRRKSCYSLSNIMIYITIYIMVIPMKIICEEECMKKVEKIVLERCSGSGSRKKRSSENMRINRKGPDLRNSLAVPKLTLDSSEILEILIRTQRSSASIVNVGNPLTRLANLAGKRQNISKTYPSNPQDVEIGISLSESDIRKLYETIVPRMPRHMNEDQIVAYFAGIAVKCCSDIDICMKQENMVSCPDD